jgi:hypothetical protein
MSYLICGAACAPGGTFAHSATMEDAVIDRYDPFGRTMGLRQVMDRLLEDAVVMPGQGGADSRPAVDVYEEDDNLIVEAHLPGFKPENLDVEARPRSSRSARSAITCSARSAAGGSAVVSTCRRLTPPTQRRPPSSMACCAWSFPRPRRPSRVASRSVRLASRP